MLYRRFGTVFSRLLLNKQDEISGMEALLHSMDKTDEKNGNIDYLKSRVGDLKREDMPKSWPKSRPELIQDLEKKSLEYGVYQIHTFHFLC